MLEIVNSQLRSLTKSDRAQMSGDFCSSFVSSLDRRRKFIRRNEVVDFEIVRAFIALQLVQSERLH